MKALYRKYRPCKLSEVVGQEQVTKTLESSLKQGRISHAYLFIGPRGTGKTSVARIFAHEVNGFKYEPEDDYVDIIEIDGASNRGIDNIRELREKVMIAPTSGKYKIYIIDEVHMLTKEAFNALLKTLEEPPNHVIFIMATTDAHKVPITITSRAQTYTFRLAEKSIMAGYLKKVAKSEKINIDDSAIDIIVKRGGGSFRDSLSLLDQISMLPSEKITKETVEEAMGLPEDEKIHELLNVYALGDVVKITTVLKDLLVSGIKPETLAEELIETIIDEPKPEFLSLLAKLPEVRAPYSDAKLLTALAINTNAKNVETRTLETKTVVRQENVISENKPKTTKVELEKTVKEETKIETPTNSVKFEWVEYLNRVQELSDAVYSQLAKTKYELIDDTLHIYPLKKIVRSILTRENNKRILTQALGSGVKITIHEIEDSPVTENKDETLAKLSDIMGGEVINDGGENPFE